MKKLILLVLTFLAMLSIAAVQMDGETPKPVPVKESTLTDHGCDSEEWHFIINQLESNDLAPEKIYVTWENGASEEVLLSSVNLSTAHYYTSLNLDSPIVEAYTRIYADWSGQFVIFNDVLYASTGNDVDGAEIWRSVTGDAGSWAPVVKGGNGNSNNNHVNSFVLFDGYLYAAGENWVEGAQVWRTANGASWTVVSANGFGNANNIHIGSIIEFKGMLYASTRNDVTGAEIFRSANGTTWTKVIDSGINDEVNMKFESLFDFNDQMYVTANNYETGLKVWQSDDGTTFTQLIDDGFGDSNNVSTLWNGAMIGFKNHLYIGTTNGANGVELWRYDIKSTSGFDIFLPLILN